MIFQLMSLAAIFVATYFAFRTAKENRRKPILWSVITLLAGLGIQFFLPIFLAILLAILYLLTGTPQAKLPEAIEGPTEIIGIACIVVSVVAAILILRFVAKVPDDGPLPPKPNEYSIYNSDE